MLYINNPEALVALETERRRGLGLHASNEPDPKVPSIVATGGISSQRHDHLVRHTV